MWTTVCLIILVSFMTYDRCQTSTGILLSGLVFTLTKGFNDWTPQWWCNLVLDVMIRGLLLLTTILLAIGSYVGLIQYRYCLGP